MSRRKSTKLPTDQRANPPAAAPKEEVGRWESEGGAPQGGRNPTAIKEGQNRETDPAAAKSGRAERKSTPRR